MGLTIVQMYLCLYVVCWRKQAYFHHDIRLRSTLEENCLIIVFSWGQSTFKLKMERTIKNRQMKTYHNGSNSSQLRIKCISWQFDCQRKTQLIDTSFHWSSHAAGQVTKIRNNKYRWKSAFENWWWNVRNRMWSLSISSMNKWLHEVYYVLIFPNFSSLATTSWSRFYLDVTTPWEFQLENYRRNVLSNNTILTHWIISQTLAQTGWSTQIQGKLKEINEVPAQKIACVFFVCSMVCISWHFQIYIIVNMFTLLKL